MFNYKILLLKIDTLKPLIKAIIIIFYHKNQNLDI